ncbi:hypothetical protein SAMN02745206_03572 [Desulfacinum infernum DSM 9756]|uniref:Uncharacterized protein TP-0789 domain-containing protein n=1 Tax=Desulfacinum infernum DSM 9756 TaxID=1121391 RepID=A0A1M5IDB0_9BACT|nr:outer membrane lipoprotein-sorting protein [Desulfacinum infernum]SHG26225.1 hypothetical protein SAMN02745206_03572 [Desulfacinum infernum DSM 9756]
MNILFLIAALATFWLWMSPQTIIAAQTDPVAAKILERADTIRNPQGDYVVHVRITDYKPEKPPKVAEYEVLVKGRDRTVVKTLAPPLDRGTTMLMLGYDMWVFMPSIRKPLRISLQQRLLGEVAYGDIARANFSGDYVPRLGKVVERKGVPCHELELTAVNEKVTYHRAKLWVATEDNRPIAAEFYAFSGKLLKTCTFEDYRPEKGVTRPHRLVLRDPLKEGYYSVMEYIHIEERELPGKYFTKEYLDKLRY